jgi:predicted dehydrogenase
LGSIYNHLSSAMAAETKAKFDVEDLAAGLVKFDNGATLVIEASWAANIKESEFMETRLYGTLGGLVQRNLDETYKFEAELFLERDGNHFDLKVHPPYPPAPTPWFHFIDCILSGKPHLATGEEGLKVMQILDALYQSAAEGGPVKIIQ